MSTKARLLDSLFYLILGTLYCFALSSGVITATILEVAPGTLLAMSAVFVLLFHIVFYNKYTGLVALGLLLIGGVILYISLRSQQFEAAWFLNLKGIILEMLPFFRNQLPLKEVYNQLAAVVIPLILALYTAVNTRVYLGFYALALLAVAVFAVPIKMEWEVAGDAMALAMLCLLVLLCKKLNLVSAAKPDGGTVARSLYALPFIPVVLAVFAVSWMLPKPEITPIEGGGFDLAGTADNLLFGFAPDQAVTFTEDGKRLGGPISLNDWVVMVVEAKERVYLSGSIRDNYTGTSWISTAGEDMPLTPDDNGVYDTADYPKALFDLQRYYMRYYGRDTKSLTVSMGQSRTKSVFTPPFRSSLELPEDVGVTENSFGRLQAAKTMPKTTQYTQEYISWNYNNSYFIAILQGTLGQGGVAGLSEEERALFLQRPESLTQRVDDLAHDLTDGLGNDYDKLKTLEQYLARFPYTLEPERVPSGEDFVDYFLFTGKEGYCVYYASALAMMARCVGIPTRYVEGFIMPEDRDENGMYTVTNQQAHAWVEAYMDGFGWVHFEATAPYARLDEEIPAEEEPVPAPEEPQPEPEQTPEPQLTPPDGESSSPALPEVNEPDQEAGGVGWVLWLLLALIVLGGVGFAGYKLILSRYSARQQKLKALSNREAVMAYFARIVRAAAVLGYPMESTETALAYGHRLGDTLLFQGQTVAMEDLAVLFSAAAYGDDEIPDRDKHRMKQCYGEMLALLRASGNGRIRYYLDRYLLLIL